MAVGQTIQHANIHMKQFLSGKMNYKEDKGGINWATGTTAAKHFTDASQGSCWNRCS